MAGMTIARQSMVQQVRDAVIELLRKEEYTAGRYIPSEQESAYLFEASRATVCELLKDLCKRVCLIADMAKVILYYRANLYFISQLHNSKA